MGRWDNRERDLEKTTSKFEKLRFVNSLSMGATFGIAFLILFGFFEESGFEIYFMVGMVFCYSVSVMALFGMMRVIFTRIRKEEMEPKMKRKLLMMLFNLGIVYVIATVVLLVIFGIIPL